MTVHFIYVKGDRISTPYAITNELATRLAQKYDLKVYDWVEKITINPAEGDVLIGHPSLLPQSVYNSSFWQKGWSKRILLNPFAHAMPEYIAFLDDLVMECDRYLAICGKYWTDTISESVVSHWQPRIEQIDLAINLNHFPSIKGKFSPSGHRKFVFIGNLYFIQGRDYKGSDYLSAIAEANPDLHIGWIGGGDDKRISNKIKVHGAVDFSNPAGLELVSSYDFLLHCGRSDANPTTILEAAAWGLIPVCTPQSGYYNEDWVVNIPLDDVETASTILRHLNSLPESQLFDYQHKARIALNSHYNWERFSQQVIDCIENKSQPKSNSVLPSEDKIRENRRILKRVEAQRKTQRLCQEIKSKIKNIVRVLKPNHDTHIHI